MNVVGKVGSLITQGVYSVATPFHPFGGAVDIIVVQQQDGTFRSTPWYVRFGKFQGVLKGAEKIVVITVNGIQADFHMYLDNSGEAYFLREVDSGKGNGTGGVVKDSHGNEFTQDDHRINCDNYNDDNLQRLEHSISDSGVAQLRGECDSLGVKRLDRAESDCVRFYEFPDDQSSLEGSVELSEYGSNHFDRLNNDHVVESQNLDSEVVLVSVDGHILTAPILASEQNTEDLQLSTPQFHLGPGEGTEFCNDGNGEFDSGEGVWAADYISKLNASKTSDAFDKMSGEKIDDNACMYEPEYCEGKRKHVSQAIEIPSSAVYDGNTKLQKDLETADASDIISGDKNDDMASVHYPKNYEGKSKHVSQAIESSSNEAHAWDTMVHYEYETGVACSNISGDKNDENACVLEPENCEGKSEHIFHAIESPSNSQAIESPSSSEAIENPRSTAHEGETIVCIDSEDLFMEIKKRDIFKSCLEPTEREKHGKGANCEDLNFLLESRPFADNFENGLSATNATEDTGAVELRNLDHSSLLCSANLPNDVSSDLRIENETVENNLLRPEILAGGGISVHSVNNDNPDFKDKHFATEATADAIGTMPQSVAEDGCSRRMVMEPLMETSTAAVQTQPSFEISLCRNKLRPAMGLDAAAEAFDAHRVSPEKFISNAGLIMKNDNLIVRFRGKYLPWDKAAPVVLGLAAFGLDLPIELKDAISVEHDDTPKSRDDDSGMASTPGRRWRLWPIPFRRVKTLEHSTSTSSNEEEFVDSESFLNNSHLETSPISHSRSESPRKQFMRTNVPTTDQIASMNLKEGQNMITFSFSTRVLGKQQVDAHIYLWKWNAKIVISDVDGTITKSDVLGQFMPLVGKDWTQSGVAKLFCAIKENGYQLLFLSARAIVQAYLTRSFLLNLKQDGKTLPSGPVVISPDGLFPSLIREVIRRAPHEFKIACLEDIKKLFPPDYNPFYAGFGNRDTDELSYRKIGIPKGKIFIINPKGEVAISHRIDVKSYTNLHTLVNDMFPPTSLVEQEDFNSWNFWRVPLPEIEL